MTRVRDHIVPGAACILCKKAPATTVTRLVAREDSMEQDALLWGAATCWACAEPLGILLEVAALQQNRSRKPDELVASVVLRAAVSGMDTARTAAALVSAAARLAATAECSEAEWLDAARAALRKAKEAT